MDDRGTHAWYAEPGALTRFGPGAEHLPEWRGDLAELCRWVQGLLIHGHWAEAYGLRPENVRRDEMQLRGAQRMLDRILERDASDLSKPRPPERRVFGTCRDFTTFGVALLRHAGVPARARCGFGAYFVPGQLEDHWVIEVWHEDAWRLVDAQIDEVQRVALKPDFDPTDVPRDAFRVAGDVWLACRSGAQDPAKVGIFDMRGLWVARGNVVRDAAALNKLELLPWDDWGLIGEEGTDPELVDVVARATSAPGTPTAELCALYEGHPGLRVPDVVSSWVDGTLVEQRWEGS